MKFLLLLVLVFIGLHLPGQDMGNPDTSFIRSHHIKVIKYFEGTCNKPTDPAKGKLTEIREFDSQGRVTERRSPDQNDGWRYVYHYNTNNELARMEYAFPPDTSRSGYYAYQYDSLHRLSDMFWPGWNRSLLQRHYLYDEKNRCIQWETVNDKAESLDKEINEYTGSDTVIQSTYKKSPYMKEKEKQSVRMMDAKGNVLLEQSFSMGHILSKSYYVYDSAGHKIQQTDSSGKGELKFITHFNWKDDVLLSTNSDMPGNPQTQWTYYEYTPDGIPLRNYCIAVNKEKKPEPPPNCIKYVYDATGKLSRKTAYEKGDEVGHFTYKYDALGRCIRADEFRKDVEEPIHTILWQYKPGEKLPSGKSEFPIWRERIRGYKSNPDDEDENPAGGGLGNSLPDFDTLSLRYERLNGKITSEYRPITREDQLSAFLDCSRSSDGWEPDPPCFYIRTADTINITTNGASQTMVLSAELPEIYPRTYTNLRLKRTLTTENGIVTSVTDTGPDGKIWLSCNREGGRIEGEYLSKCYSRAGKKEYVFMPYYRDTLLVNHYDDSGRLVRQDSAHTAYNYPIRYEYAGNHVSRKIVETGDNGSIEIAYTWNTQNQLIKAQTTEDGSPGLIIEYKYSGGLLREETYPTNQNTSTGGVQYVVPDLPKVTYERYEYEFYQH